MIFFPEFLENIFSLVLFICLTIIWLDIFKFQSSYSQNLQVVLRELFPLCLVVERTMQLITDGMKWPRPWENALLAPPANCITYNASKSIINLSWGTFYARALLPFQTVNCSALEISITLWYPMCISLIAFFSFLSLFLLPLSFLVPWVCKRNSILSVYLP